MLVVGRRSDALSPVPVGLNKDHAHALTHVCWPGGFEYRQNRIADVNPAAEQVAMAAQQVGPKPA